MSSLRVALDEILPVKEASRTLPRALSRLESREADHLVITRRSKPAAVLLAIDRYEELLRAATRGA
jgi:hypothetical protein